jgi:serine hydrolase
MPFGAQPQLPATAHARSPQPSRSYFSVDESDPVVSKYSIEAHRSRNATATPAAVTPSQILIAHWAAEHGHRRAGLVLAALLVAPADVEAPTAREAVHGFRPVPLAPLPFSSVVVASRTDEYLSYERATELARAWGSSLVDAGNAGHLNTDAGYGPWPAGERILMNLAASVA